MLYTATRNENGGRGEDRVLVTRLADALICVLADGAGGVGGGAHAANLVVEITSRALADAESLDGAACVASLRAADSGVALGGSGGLATGVVAVVTQGGIVGASVGDSGAIVACQSGVLDLTRAQVRRPLLGDGGAKPTAFSFEGQFSRLLVASDGLFKYAPWQQLCDLARAQPLDHAADALVACVRLRSGALPDDVSLVLVEAAV